MSCLFGGALSPGVLSAAAGHPVRTPPALLQGTSLHDHFDKQMLFLVEEGGSRPFAIVKWARGPEVNSLRAEQEALQLMRGSGDPFIMRSCPPIWGPFSTGQETAVTLQRCLPGLSIYAQLRTSPWPRDLTKEHFDRVAEWLARFWAVTGQPAHPFDENDISKEIEQPLLIARERLGGDVIPQRALQATLEAARVCIGQPVRFVAQHGDLWASNLLMFGRQLCAVDWEDFRPESLPTFDMVFFCTTYAVNFPWRPFGWAGHEKAFARTYLRPTWLSKHVRRFLTLGCLAGGFSRSLLPIMLPVTLAQMALRRELDMGRGEAPPQNPWSEMLRAWWTRPADNWLEAWARQEQRTICAL